MIKEFNIKLQKGLAKREVLLRNRLSREYELKLKKKIQEHEAFLKKKKLELEFEMQNKIGENFPK